MTNEELIRETSKMTRLVCLKLFGIFPPQGYTEDEIRKIALAGMWRATKKWDGTRSFFSYSFCWIKAVILDDMKIRQSGVHIGYRVRKKMQLVRAYCERRGWPIQSLDSTSRDVQADLKMSEGQIDRAKRAAFYDGLFRPFSLLTSNGADNDDDRSLLDMKSDVDALWSSGEVVEPEDLIERAELGAKLARAISELNLKEWQLSLLRRIFVDGLDIAEAGREFGKSRALSHYHYKKMLRQLRALLISPT